jgi:hypothetical protein
MAETVELLRSSRNADAAFEQVGIAIQKHSVDIFTKETLKKVQTL